jgi:hypothetical protein
MSAAGSNPASSATAPHPSSRQPATVAWKVVTVADGAGTSSYRIDTAVVLRAVGALFVLVGLAWVVVVLTAGSSVLHALAAVTVVLAVLSVWATIRPPRVLTLSDAGFRVRLVRGARTTAASWREVESVSSGPVRGTSAVVLTLSGGRSTVIPVFLLGRRNVEAQRDIHQRLNDAYGYRHLDAP